VSDAEKKLKLILYGTRDGTLSDGYVFVVSRKVSLLTKIICQ